MSDDALRVALYTRVSSQEQAQEGFSLDAQLHRLKGYCELNEWTIADVYTDEGISAKDTDRPELQRMLNDAAQGKFDIVFVTKLDRLTRSVLDLHEMLNHFDKHGVGFKSATEVFDTTTATGRLFITMVAAMAQWERETIGERVREGQAQMVREGRYFGHTAPYGYTLANGKLAVNHTEAAVIRKIFDLYLTGNGASRISKFLNDPSNQILRPHGANEWSQKVVLDILKNPVYAGYVRYGNKSKLNKGKSKKLPVTIAKSDHEPLITEFEFEQVQNMMERRTVGGARSGTGTHPLVGILRCGLCGGAMIGRTERAGRSGRINDYHGYMCNNRRHKRTCTMKMWKKDTLEDAVIKELERIRSDHSPQLDMPTEDMDAKQYAIVTSINKLAAERQRWLKAYSQEAITADELREQRVRIEREQRALEEQLRELQRDESASIFDELLADVRETWAMATDGERKEIIRSVADTIYVYEDGSVHIDLCGGF